MRSNSFCPQGIHSPRIRCMGHICPACSLFCTLRAWFLTQSMNLKTDLVHMWKANFKPMSRTLICYQQMIKQYQVFLNLNMHAHRQLLCFSTGHRKISNNNHTSQNWFSCRGCVWHDCQGTCNFLGVAKSQRLIFKTLIFIFKMDYMKSFLFVCFPFFKTVLQPKLMHTRQML